MNEYKNFISNLVESDDVLKKEMELLELKYAIIDELIRYRKSNNLTQAQFAEIINVKQQAISRFEKGEIDPRISFVSKVLHGIKKKIVFSDSDYVKVNHPIVQFTSKKKRNKAESDLNNEYSVYGIA